MEYLNGLFSIETETFDKWRERNSKNNFFELAYILNGKGRQCVNHEWHPYTKGELFVLPATKCYKYDIEVPTTFLFIRFSENYFTPDANALVDYSSWFSKLNFILGNHDRHPGEIIRDRRERLQVNSLLHIMLAEYKKKDLCADFIIQNCLVSVLAMVSRNVQQHLFGRKKYDDARFANILAFINYNILDSALLTVEALSNRFHISHNYFGEYFKRNAEISFKAYLLNAKLNIAATRAAFTTLSFKEIAVDLGFTDSSHLNRMMKKHYGNDMRYLRSNGLPG